MNVALESVNLYLCFVFVDEKPNRELWSPADSKRGNKDKTVKKEVPDSDKPVCIFLIFKSNDRLYNYLVSKGWFTLKAEAENCAFRFLFLLPLSVCTAFEMLAENTLSS